MRAALLLALAGCLPAAKPYVCDSADDCTGGVGGSCIGGLCAFEDQDCLSGLSFGELAGDQAGGCVEAPSIPLRNACVAGEPSPTKDQACASAVCEDLPQCCTGVWSSACVQRAQQRCETTCSVIAAAAPGQISIARWDGERYTTVSTLAVPAATHVRWFMAEAAHRPALAIATGATLAIASPVGDNELELGISRTFDRPITALVAADVDGDPVPELVVAFGGPPEFVVVSLALEDVAVEIPPTLRIPTALTRADVNDDGAPDLLVTEAAGYDVLLRNGTGFTGSTISDMSLATLGIEPADVDGDRDLDLLVAGSVSGQLYPFDGATFGAPRVFRSPSHAFALGDLDGAPAANNLPSGQPELVLVGSPDDMPMTFELLNVFGYVVGDDPFVKVHETASEPGADLTRLHIADVDGDGRLDVIAGTARALMTWFKNTGAPGTIELTLQPQAIPATTFDVTGW